MSKPLARLCSAFVLILFLSTVLVTVSFAQTTPTPLAPNSIQVSRIQYDGNSGNNYVSPYAFPEIFNDQAGCTTLNDICNIAGIQGSIYIDQFGSVPQSAVVGTLPLPSTGASAPYPTVEPGSYITTSFSSKSEGALTLSVDGQSLTYMGYQGADQLDDVSNSYSPNPAYQLVPNTYTDSNGNPYPFYDREVALIGASGLISLTPIDNAFSGDNPRAAITLNGNQFYMGGNSDSTESGSKTITGPGLTIGARCGTPLNSQSYQLGTYVAADRPDESAKKHIKDNNWRGIGIYTDGSGVQQLYVSKGSGSNGDDGIFQVGTGLPSCIVNGTDTNNTITEILGAPVTNQTTQAPTPYLPFGFWFANPTTLYVADEGNPGSYAGGDSVSFSNATNGTYVPSNDPYAGLEKWSLVNGTWTLDYTIQAGLNFNVPQTFPGYNDVNGDPIQSYPYGLRNMTGVNNGDGTVTIYAITAQFSAASGGESDPDALVGITDTLAATTLPANEQFVTLQTSGYQEVFRGVAYVPPASGFSRMSQTITFPSVGALTYGVSPITLTATATSGWPIAYTVSGPATLSGNVLTITGAGKVTVQASQSGNTDYAGATVQQTINVSQAPLTVTVNNVSSTYGSAIPPLSFGFSGFVNGDSATSLTGTLILSTPATSSSPVGTYPINTIDSLSSANYSITLVPGNVTINPAQLTVTPNNATTTYGTIPPFTASYAGFVNGDSSSVLSGAPALSTTATSTSDVGTYSITASQGTLTAANYTFAFGTGTLTINQASQTISFSINAPVTAQYNTSFTVAASASSGLAVSYGSAGSCTNVGSTYTITSGTGTCTVTATQPGNLDYTAASPVNESTSIGRANPTVTFTGAPATSPYGSSFVMVATTNASGTAYITGTNPTVCQLSGPYSPVTVSILKDAGKCTFTASWGADANYNPATATQTTTAVKAVPILTWQTPAPISYGTALSATQLDATANVTGTFTYSPTSGKIENVGNSTLKVTLKPTDTNYSTATAEVTLQVVQTATTTVITSTSPTVTMNSEGVATSVLDFNVGSYKPTGAVTLTASTGEVCSGTVAAGTGNGSCKLTFTTTGTRTVAATYAGDGNHLGSNNSEQTPAITVTVNHH